MASKRVLTVGDGDLSFSLALVRAFDIQVVATTWLSAEDLVQRYRSAAGTRDELLERGMPVLHEVDACNLQKLPELGYVDPFDVAMFNFPHLGDVAVDCHRPDSEHVRKHVALLSHFLHSARSVACEVHITLCGEQAALWDLHGSAERLGWLEHRRLVFIVRFCTRLIHTPRHAIANCVVRMHRMTSTLNSQETFFGSVWGSSLAICHDVSRSWEWRGLEARPTSKPQPRRRAPADVVALLHSWPGVTHFTGHCTEPN